MTPPHPKTPPPPAIHVIAWRGAYDPTPPQDASSPPPPANPRACEIPCKMCRFCDTCLGSPTQATRNATHEMRPNARLRSGGASNKLRHVWHFFFDSQRLCLSSAFTGEALIFGQMWYLNRREPGSLCTLLHFVSVCGFLWLVVFSGHQP